MRVNDCTDPLTTRAALVLPIKLIVVHHCSLATAGSDNPQPISDELLTGANLATTFERMAQPEPRGLGTGGCRPYHALIRVDGQVDQCISLARRGAHALAYNVNTLAVATVGEHGVNEAQRRSLVEVLADWIIYAEGCPVVGHTSLADGTTPGHPVCPHPTTDLVAIVNEALDLTRPMCKLTLDQRAQAVRAGGWVV
jgi:hypothetical protein